MSSDGHQRLTHPRDHVLHALHDSEIFDTLNPSSFSFSSPTSPSVTVIHYGSLYHYSLFIL